MSRMSDRSPEVAEKTSGLVVITEVPSSRPSSDQEMIIDELGIIPGSLGLLAERQSAKNDRQSLLIL